MRPSTRHLVTLLAAGGIGLATATLTAAGAAAEPGQQSCQTTPGGTYTGTGETECQSPGNVQIDATAPAPVYPYPWDDEFYGSALIIGGPWGPHGGGTAGGGGGGHR